MDKPEMANDTETKLNRILQWLGLDKPAEEPTVEPTIEESTVEPTLEEPTAQEPTAEHAEETTPTLTQEPPHNDERDQLIATLKRDNAIKDARLAYPQLTAEDFELCQETEPDKINAWAQRFAQRVGASTQGQHKLADQAKKANERISKTIEGESAAALYKKALEANNQ